MTTDDFNIDDRVQIINAFANELIGECGTVINRDAYTVAIRLDRIKPELMGYGDCKTGVVNSEPSQIRKIKEGTTWQHQSE